MIKKHTTHTPAGAVGMQKLGPGVYVDRDGHLHLWAQEVCEHFGVPCTETNERIVRQAIIESLRQEYGEDAPKIVHVDD